MICRQLGLSGGRAIHGAHYGQGSGPIWARYMYCTGSELSLTDCTGFTWGTGGCGHHEDAGVVCEIGYLSQAIEGIVSSNI